MSNFYLYTRYNFILHEIKWKAAKRNGLLFLPEKNLWQIFGIKCLAKRTWIEDCSSRGNCCQAEAWAEYWAAGFQGRGGRSLKWEILVQPLTRKTTTRQKWESLCQLFTFLVILAVFVKGRGVISWSRNPLHTRSEYKKKTIWEYNENTNDKD